MSEDRTATLSMPEPDVALVTLDTPNKGANVLSASVLDELAELLDDLENRSDLAGLIIISGKPGTFIAGADLREFAESMDSGPEQIVGMCRKGQTLFARLSRCPFVTVAAIDGVCLGGGAELAVWCDRRVLADNDKTSIGFPEVKIGLYPGWGGTVRAPRIVGLGNAVELISGGEPVVARSAWAMGLADDVVSPDQLLAAAINMVRLEQASGDFRHDRERWAGPLSVNETELGFLGITASAVIREQTKGHYPAPQAAVELMFETAFTDAESACVREAEGMVALFGSPVNAALINVFFLTDRVKKDTGIEQPGVQPAEISRVGVVGAGIMGGGIAAAHIKRHVPVTLTDASPEALAAGTQKILEEVSYNKSTKRSDVDRVVQFAPLIHGTMLDDAFRTCDLVIEAVVERIDIKAAVFSRLEPLLRDAAILASNTSTLPISQLAANVQRPERFCGIHFFNPVRQMQLVEVIRGEQTSDQTVATAVEHVRKIGKLPVVVNDGPGFLVNRLLFPYMSEALELVCQGVSFQEIDRAAVRFGMPMGPLALYDMVGIDTALFAGRTMAEAFPDRVRENPLLQRLVDAGRLGKKSGGGFYSYSNRKGRAEPDPEVASLFAGQIQTGEPVDRDELTTRLFMPMFLEATHVLADRIVRDPRDVDFGLIYGVGFPAFRGGLLWWADTMGAAQIVDMLKPLESLGERMKPTDLLLEMAADGTKFYR